jgi:predicted Zn-dependent protease
MRLPVVVLLAFLTLSQSRPSLASDNISLDDADESRIGSLLAAQFAKLEGLSPTPQATKIARYLQSVGERLTVHARRKLSFHFHFDADPSFKSAFALPGGEIFVGAGVLAMMDTEDQLAIVLGHEMEHVDLNQCRDRLLEELTKQHLTLASADQLKVDPFLPGYGHEREFAADWEGVKLAAEAGYSPEGAVRLLNMYIILGRQMTHTSSEAEKNLQDRIAQIERLIAEEKLATPKERDLALP